MPTSLDEHRCCPTGISGCHHCMSCHDVTCIELLVVIVSVFRSHAQDPEDEEAALLADISNLDWAIARVQVAIAQLRPLASTPATLDLATCGLNSQQLGTESSLGAIDAALRARGCKCAVGCAAKQPTLAQPRMPSVCHADDG